VVFQLCSFHGFAVHTERHHKPKYKVLDPLPVCRRRKEGVRLVRASTEVDTSGSMSGRARYSVGIQTSTDFVRASNDQMVKNYDKPEGT